MIKKSRKFSKFSLHTCLKVLTICLFAAFSFYTIDGLARAGGGHSYSGGSRSSGGSSSSSSSRSHSHSSSSSSSHRSHSSSSSSRKKWDPEAEERKKREREAYKEWERKQEEERAKRRAERVAQGKTPDPTLGELFEDAKNSSGGIFGAILIFGLIAMAFLMPILTPVLIIFLLVRSKKNKSKASATKYFSSNTNSPSSANNNYKPVATLTTAVYSNDATKRAKEHNTYLKTLKAADANFSEPLFYDFAQLLFVRILCALGDNEKLKVIAPYITDEALAAIKRAVWQSDSRQIKDVVIGSFAMHDATANDERLKVVLTLETDYTLVSDGAERRYYLYTTLVLVKKAGVLSKGPGEITALGCPCCGASDGITPAGLCAHCGSAVTSGEYQWVITSLRDCDKEAIKLVPGSEHVEEVGTDLPTVFDPDLASKLAELKERHPGFDQARLEERVKEAFFTIQEAWSSQRWELARPYESDSIFEMHRFWIENYKRHGRRSLCEKVNIAKIELVKVDSDKFYEAVTYRIHASMLDYVVDSQGNVTSGDKYIPRAFTEYWTFIRSRDFSEKAYNSHECPNCGAEIKLNQAGKCEYCGTVVTGGNFDWVLSRIEQDESYMG